MNLQSLGHASALYQRPPQLIESAIRVVQAEEALAAGNPIPKVAQSAIRLNGVPYFEADDVADAIAYLAKSDAKDALDKAQSIEESTLA